MRHLSRWSGDQGGLARRNDFTADPFRRRHSAPKAQPRHYCSDMHRILAAASAASLVFGLIIGVAPTSSADASPGTVTVSVVGGVTSLTSSTVQAEIGDTFVLQDNTGDAYGFFVRNNSGSVSAAGVSCTGANCTVDALIRPSITLTVTAFGTLTVQANAADFATLTITAGSSGGGSAEPALVYPTATIDANGGTCTGPSQFIKASGQNASGGTLTAPTASSCTRTNYTLVGWALSAAATTSAFSAGSTVPIGDESFTLYAVWSPLGVEIRYNANVGNADQCTQGGTNVVGGARQSAAVVLQPGGAVAAAAPCTPVDARLVGWSLTGNGPSVVAAGAALPSSFAQGSSHVLYAKWQVTYGLTSTPESVSVRQGESGSVTFTATVNGAAAAGRSVDVVGVGALIGTSGTIPAVIATGTTNRAGQVTVTVSLTGTIAQVRASFGNVSVTVPVTVAQPKSITIVGERTTVSGKPGIRVDGVATGFPAGTRVVPWFRFPGQTGFTQGSARPEIGDDGSVSWQRKTGKKTTVYFATEDGSVQSNRVIIPAN